MGIVAILCSIGIEYQSVRRYLNNLEAQITEGASYEIGTFEGRNQTYKIVIQQIGAKNTDIAVATDRIIQNFNPSIILLVGIAGGVKDVTIGDIVVATKAYGYSGGKAVDGSFLARPESIPYDTELVDQARSLVRQPLWEQKSATLKKIPKVIFGPIASSDTAITSIRSPIYQTLKQHFNDTTAIEMESAGFAQAASRYKHIGIMNIVGIADLLDKKSHTDAKESQRIAADHAAAFTFSLLELDLKHIKTHSHQSSKNVISNSTINAGGNMNLGDVVKHTGSSTSQTGNLLEDL